MSDNDTDHENARHDPAATDASEQQQESMGGRTADGTDSSAPNGDRRTGMYADTTWVELTGFQRDLLTCIRQIDDQTTIPTGTTIKRAIESMYGETINHGRLYQNLNHLAECNCIDKIVVDGRTNAYYLTDEAIGMLDETAKQLVSACGLQQSITES